MDDETRKMASLEIAAVFKKHGINSITEMVGILEVTKTLAILAGSTDALAGVLEKRSVRKAAEVNP